jgi:hypothetical protein
VSEEEQYWAERREREDAEFEYRQRRRKTLPWNIAAGVILVAALLYIVVRIATNS